MYELLDRSLDPRGPEVMLTLATDRLTPASVVLDVGCRDASHLIELVRATGATGVGIDPLARFVERSRDAVVEAGLEGRIRIAEAAMEDIPRRTSKRHSSAPGSRSFWRTSSGPSGASMPKNGRSPCHATSCGSRGFAASATASSRRPVCQIYAHIESNLHWLVYQFLGKLLPTIYLLRKAG